MTTPKDLLTAGDVDQGYHDEPVRRLDGTETTIRIHLPTWRVRQKLGERIAADGGFEFLLVHCLIPPGGGGGPGRAADGGSSPASPFEAELQLDRLDPESLNRCFALALAAVMGNDLAKKVVAASREKVALGLAAALGTNGSATGSASSADASAPDGPPPTSPDGTGAGSSSSPASAKSNPSSTT